MKQLSNPEPVETSQDGVTPIDAHPDFVPAPRTPLFPVVELKDWGSNLPVGVIVGGKRVRPFRLRPFRLKEEKELSRMKEDAKGMTIGMFVANVLGTMVATCGPHNFDQMKQQERVLAITQMSVADVLYMYVWLRYEALGPKEPVVMALMCPACHADYKWYGDLSSLEVKTVPDDMPTLERPYTLRDAIKIRGEERSNITLAPLNWSVFMSPGFNLKGKRESLVLQHSIVGVEGVAQKPFMMAESELDELTKFDIAGLSADIDEYSPGPQLKVEPVCPTCNHKAAMMLDWGYDSFFSRSAQRTRTTA